MANQGRLQRNDTLTESEMRVTETYGIKDKLAFGCRQQKARDALRGKAIPGAGNDASDGPGLLGEETHLFQKLILGHVLGSLEHVRLGNLAKSKLVDVHKSPEGDQPHEGIVRQEINGLRKCRLQEGHLLFDDAGVHHKQEDRGDSGAIRGGLVFDGGVVGEELGWEIVLGDGGVVRREMVALEAEGADPYLGSEVDYGEGIQDRAAGAAAKRGIREQGHGWEGFQRGVYR